MSKKNWDELKSISFAFYSDSADYLLESVFETYFSVASLASKAYPSLNTPGSVADVETTVIKAT